MSASTSDDIINKENNVGNVKVKDWGPWSLDTETRVLDGPKGYYVDLDQCQTSAQVLDWVVQVATKSWADAEVVMGLLRAINDILRPQSNLCSSGVHKTMSDAQIKAAVKAYEGFRG